MSRLSFNINENIPDFSGHSELYHSFRRVVEEYKLDEKDESISNIIEMSKPTIAKENEEVCSVSSFLPQRSCQKSTRNTIKKLICSILGRTNNPIVNLKAFFLSSRKAEYSVNEFVYLVKGFIKVHEVADPCEEDFKLTNEEIENSLKSIFENIDHSNSRRINFEDFIDYIMTFAKREEEDNNRKYKYDQLLEFNSSELNKCLFFLPQSNSFISVLKNREIRFINPVNLELERVILESSQKYEILSVESIPEANQLVVSNSGMTVNFYELVPSRGRKLRKLYHKNFLHVGSMTKIVYSKHHQCLFSSTIRGGMLIWNTLELGKSIKFCTSEFKCFNKHTEYISDMIISQQQGKIYSCSLDSTILNHKIRNSQLVSVPLRCNHKNGVFGISYNDQHDFLISCGREPSAFIYLGRNTKPFQLFDERKPQMHSIQFVKTVDNEIFTLDCYGILKIYDVRTFRAIQTIQTEEISNINSLESQSNIVNSLLFLPHGISKSKVGKRIISSGTSIKVFNFQKANFPERACDEEITDVFFEPRNQSIIVCTTSRISLYDITGKMYYQLKKISGSEITAVCLDPSGKQIYIGNHNGFIYSYDLATGNRLRRYKLGTSKSKDYGVEVSKLGFVGKLISCQWNGWLSVFESIEGSNSIVSESYSSKKKDSSFGHDDDILSLDTEILYCSDTNNNNNSNNNNNNNNEQKNYDFYKYYNKEEEEKEEKEEEEKKKRIIGRRVITGDKIGKIILWSISSGLYIQNIFSEELLGRQPCREITFLEKTHFVASNDRGFLFLFQAEFPFRLLKKWENVNKYEIFLNPVTSIKYCKELKMLICGDKSGTMTIYDFSEIMKNLGKFKQKIKEEEIGEIKVIQNFKAHLAEINKLVVFDYEYIITQTTTKRNNNNDNNDNNNNNNNNEIKLKEETITSKKKILMSSCVASEVFFWDVLDQFKKLGELRQESSGDLNLIDGSKKNENHNEIIESEEEEEYTSKKKKKRGKNKKKINMKKRSKK